VSTPTVNCVKTTAYSSLGRLDELETEILELRSSLPNFLSSTSHPIHDTSPLSQAMNHNSSTSPNRLPSQSVDNSFLDILPAASDKRQCPPSEHLASSHPRSLGQIHLSPQHIDSLFCVYACKFPNKSARLKCSRFFKIYHPYAPLLDPSISPDNYFSKSPLLFWIIIYTSSRRYQEQPSLLKALTLPVTTLVWKTFSSPPHTWYIVQAASLLCMWPFPTSSLSTDTTPMLVSIMQTIAMHIGLHEPDSIQDFSRTKRKLSSLELSEVAKTWSLCYIASQR
jgi:hypothetical protein